MAYKDGWMWKRFESLPEIFGSGELKRTLRVTHRTISNWRDRELFHRSKVAVQRDNGFWEWNKDRLRLWLCAIGAIKASKTRRMAKNPPAANAKGFYPTRSEAIEALQDLSK